MGNWGDDRETKILSEWIYLLYVLDGILNLAREHYNESWKQPLSLKIEAEEDLSY